MIGGIRIGRIFGVELRLDWSWIFIFVLMSWSLSSMFAVWHPFWAPGEDVALGVLGSLLFFASVLLHELAHTGVATLQGLPVRSITLFLFGGISNIEREPSSPRVEFLTAIVGPLTSIALGFLLVLAVGIFRGLPAELTDPALYLASLDPIQALVLWLGTINLVIGTFNLVPAFPLDGGRVLRSLLWAVTGDLHTATQASSIIGQLFGWSFVMLGIAMSFGARVPFFGTGVGSGLWLAFIGWFLASAAAQSFRRVLMDEALAGMTVSNLMRRGHVVFPSEATIRDVVNAGFMRTDERAFPVTEDGGFVGLVCVEDVRRAPQDAWDTTEVRAIMTPVEQLTTTTADEPLTSALAKLARLDVEQLPVVRRGAESEQAELVGMLHRRDIARWLELQSGHGPHRAPPSHGALAH